jgi:hypothetical protein
MEMQSKQRNPQGERGKLLTAHCGTASHFALCGTSRLLHVVLMMFSRLSAFVSAFKPWHWHFRICFEFRASEFGFAEIPMRLSFL